MHRRTSIGALARAALAIAAAALHAPSQAQPSPWPNGTIRIVTPTPVGVGTDAFARLYAELLGRALKTSVIVENRPGASSTLGADVVAKSAPNGSTLLISTSIPFTVAPSLLQRIPYDARKDLVPVAQLYRGGSFLMAGPAFGGKTVKDLVDLATRQPDTINYASYGPGSTAHLGMEQLQDAAKIQLVHIPYKQSAMPDLIGGQVALGWEPPNSALQNIRSGKVRALAYTGDKRSPALPDVPTLAESFPGLEVFTWVGVWAPAGTPEPVIQRLHEVFTAITADAEVLKAMAAAGNEPMAGTRAQMQSTLDREAQAMARLIKAKNISIN